MRFSHLAIAVAAIAVGTTANAANLVINGSFDADTTATKINFQGNVTGWTGGAALTFLAPPGSADDPAQYLAVYGPFEDESPDGGNFILADGDPSYSDAFSQTINGLTIGGKYKIDFYQAAGQQLGFTGATTERWSVTFGTENFLSDMFELPEAAVGPWEAQSYTFTATSVSQVLIFLAVGTPGGAPPISMLDGVSLTAVPEPATWALLIGGFAMVGVAARRRRTTVVA
ncbi:PEPxxWA-CTERM sorting domain-containing protein [Glacieibacterium frigidum]|uniref:PEP-CTERM sorting domain-containing protein n=1 Tax=Glacieibacterium frigidum TaxID=2593303 RepID=A0A552UA54_9SPHN|nr:PEPxxWA-CTERM sorting domain-containing protein [Glacieibacterium frigidum]TRW15091.1 PEP-CTERM sorting domain-containing protein [Glacieibacterium frigidum]